MKTKTGLEKSFHQEQKEKERHMIEKVVEEYRLELSIAPVRDVMQEMGIRYYPKLEHFLRCDKEHWFDYIKENVGHIKLRNYMNLLSYQKFRDWEINELRLKNKR